MTDEFSDILGGALPSRYHKSKPNAGMPTTTIVSGLVALGLGFLLCSWVWMNVLKWRERSYKLSMRRKHGIPDNDHRPFNVAYAAAMRARERRQAVHPRAVEEDFVAAVPQDDSGSRKRNPSFQHSEMSIQNPARFTQPFPPHSQTLNTAPSISSSHTLSAYSSRVVTFADGLNTSASPISEQAIDISDRRPSRRTHGILKANSKRELDDYETFDDDHFKKSRIEGEQLIDGDEEAAWRSDRPHHSGRGSKRVLGDEDDQNGISEKSRGKRRQVLPDQTDMENDHIKDEGMELDEVDRVPEMQCIPRGKKRDRLEAGSTVGADDEDDEGGEELTERTRRRKRRNQRKSEGRAPSGKKRRNRDWDHAAGDDEGDSDSLPQVAKKGRKSKSSQAEEPNDVSMDGESGIALGGKNVGDEWESNGVRYRIGSDGTRQRQVLLKKEKQRFMMPQDSVHPDRDANLEVYVETWLSEAEFHKAKADHLLAWQDHPIASIDPLATPVKNQSSDNQAGKHLLWSTDDVQSLPSTPDSSFGASRTMSDAVVPPRSLGHSVVTNVGLQLSILPPPSNKRIAFHTAVSSPSLVDSTNSSPRRPSQRLSKWEKQDLEAKAMMAVRDSNKKKDEEAKAKAEKERLDTQRASAPVIPTISLTKPAEERKPSPLATAPPLTAGNTSESNADKTKPSAMPLSFPSQPLSSNSTLKPPTSSLSFPTAQASAPAPAKAPEPSKPSGFHPSAPGAPGVSLGVPASGQPSASGFPQFHFNAGAQSSSSVPVSAEPKKDASQGSVPASGSLFSRLGSQEKPAPPATPGPAPPQFSFAKPPAATEAKPQLASGTAFSTPSNTPPTANPIKFSFGPPPKSNPGTGFPASSSAVPQEPKTAAPLSAAAATSAPKFNFGFSSAKPDTNKPTAATARPELSFAFGAPKDDGFSQNRTPLTPPAGSVFGGNGGSAFGTQKLAFGTSDASQSSSSAFGTPDASKSLGSVFGSGTSAFGSSPLGGSTSQTPPAFGGTSNVFGSGVFGSSAKPAEPGLAATLGGASAASNSATAEPQKSVFPTPINNPLKPREEIEPKSAFSFGNSSGTSTETSKPTDPTPKPAFSFGSSSATPSSSGAPAKLSFTPSSSPSKPPVFSFNSASSAATSTAGNQASREPTKAVFPFGGAPSMPLTGEQPSEVPKSLFGFGTGTSSSTSTPTEIPKPVFSFGGASAAPSSSDKPAEAPKTSFSFGGPAPSVSFGFGVANTPSASGASTTPQNSPFANSATSVFGKPTFFGGSTTDSSKSS